MPREPIEDQSPCEQGLAKAVEEDQRGVAVSCAQGADPEPVYLDILGTMGRCASVGIAEAHPEENRRATGD